MVAGLALVAVVVLPVPAAGEETRYLTPADLGPGRCHPEVVLSFQDIDCRFPLLDPTLELDPFGGPYLADTDWTYDEENDERASCSIEGDHLVCRAIPTYYTPGEHRVSLFWGWEATDVGATFTVLDGGSVAAEFVAVGAGEPYVLEDRPLRMWVYDWVPAGELWGKLRTRDTDIAVATVPILDAPTGDAVELSLAGVPPGRYRLQPCVGEDPLDCELVPGSIPLQVGTGELVEAAPGWNRHEGDRINLILAGSGFPSFEEFATIGRRLLSLDGPLLLGEDVANPLEPDTGAGDVWSVVFGPFATEPLRSAISKFNIWLLVDDVADHHAMFHDGTFPDWIDTAGFGLDDVQITTLEYLPNRVWRRSEASWPSFTGVGPNLPDRDGLGFAGAYVAVDPYSPLTAAPTLTHELGHALFDLRDEYTETSRTVTFGYPNCAPDQDTADAWWGDLVGQVDPFAAEYREVMTTYDLWVPETLEDDLTVGFVRGGCYGDESGGAIRPTADSMMNSEVPVFGGPSRRWIESILDLWSGMGPMVAADLDLTCVAAGPSSTSALCRGSVSEYAIVEDGGLAVSFASTSAPCRIEDTADGRRVACDPLRLPGAGTWVLGIGPPGTAPVGTVAVDTGLSGIDLPEPYTIPTTTSTTSTSTTTTTAAPPAQPGTTVVAADPAAGQPSGAAVWPYLLVGAAVVAGLTGGAAWWARRRT